ncbi:MAG TPA: urea ABC transporter permease subunit UrtB [Verrucomicrobiae bacterium]|nr:urea ABC transporter permease subunit UrtB [Verrucomicrobiae bacterium]
MIACRFESFRCPHALRGLRLIFLLAAALLAGDARAAGPREYLVQALTTNDVDAQIKLVQKLTDAQDPLVAQGLAAWRQGGVFLRDSGGNAKTPFLLDAITDSAGKARGIDIATGEIIKDAAGNPLWFLATDLTAVDTTSKLRKAIKTTMDVLALSSLNSNIRRDAASKLGLEQNRDYLAYFQAHLETEKVPDVRKALEEAAAITQLASDQADVRLAAVRTLDRLRSVTALDLILKLEKDNAAGSKNADPGLLTALRMAHKDIEQHISWGNFIGTCFRGLSLSAVLLIAALGLAITFGLMGIINMAHGEMIMIGAYCAYLAQNFFIRCFGQGTRGFDWYFIAALPFSFVAAGLVGLLLERGVIRFLYKRPLESLLATWGVSLVLQQLMRAIFGAANVQVYSPSWLSGNISYEDVSFPHNRIFVIGFALGIVALTWLLLTKTSLGLQVRAVMQNRQMAACLGVRIDRVNMATFAFGSGLAGMAGACLSQIGNIGPSLGQSHIVDCFMVVVLGGVGNLVGTVSAALGIGVTDQVLQPHLGAVLGKITVLSAIILFLQWRPAGLFAARSRSLD